LASVTDTVPAEKLALRITLTGRRYTVGELRGDCPASEIRNYLARSSTKVYHSDRYACEYLQSGGTVIWYLNEEDDAVRRQTAACFGVGLICVEGT